MDQGEHSAQGLLGLLMFTRAHAHGGIDAAADPQQSGDGSDDGDKRK